MDHFKLPVFSTSSKIKEVINPFLDSRGVYLNRNFDSSRFRFLLLVLGLIYPDSLHSQPLSSIWLRFSIHSLGFFANSELKLNRNWLDSLNRCSHLSQDYPTCQKCGPVHSASCLYTQLNSRTYPLVKLRFSPCLMLGHCRRPLWVNRMTHDIKIMTTPLGEVVCFTQLCPLHMPSSF